MKARFALLMAALVILAPLEGEDYPPEALKLPAPPYPYLALHASGIVVVHVRFDTKGNAVEATVLRALAPQALISSARDFILGYWKMSSLASKAFDVPIIYDAGDLPSGEFCPIPPNFLSPGEPERKLTLRVSFLESGLVKSVTVVKSSGSPNVDARAVHWVGWYWCIGNSRGETVTIPIVFEPVANKA